MKYKNIKKIILLIITITLGFMTGYFYYKINDNKNQIVKKNNEKLDFNLLLSELKEVQNSIKDVDTLIQSTRFYNAFIEFYNKNDIIKVGKIVNRDEFSLKEMGINKNYICDIYISIGDNKKIKCKINEEVILYLEMVNSNFWSCNIVNKEITKLNDCLTKEDYIKNKKT